MSNQKSKQSKDLLKATLNKNHRAQNTESSPERWAKAAAELEASYKASTGQNEDIPNEAGPAPGQEDKPRAQLETRFRQSVKDSPNPRVFPTEHELMTDYAKASKADLYYMVCKCASWICIAADFSIIHNRDLTVAQELRKEWTKYTPKQWEESDRGVAIPSLVDMRELLRRAFRDIETFMERVDSDVDVEEVLSGKLVSEESVPKLHKDCGIADPPKMMKKHKEKES